MSDEDHVRRVVDAATAVDGVAPLNEDALLALAASGLTGAELYTEPEGFALVRDDHVDLVVAPDARGQGMGTRLLDRVLDGRTSTLKAWSHGDHPAARAMAASHGFEAVRTLLMLRRPAGPVPTADSDLVVRTFQPGDEDSLLAVNALAFAHHPEQGTLDLSGLRLRMSEPWFDPEGLFLAVDDTKLLGFHWTKVHPDGTGEVYVMAVAPSAAGRGIGRLLLAVGLEHLQPRDVILYVEADNEPAVSLYDSLGFRPAGVDVHYVRRARP